MKTIQTLTQFVLASAVVCSWPTTICSQDSSGSRRPAALKVPAPSGSPELESTKRRLVEKYDLNRNGKIDVEERHDYVRELAKERVAMSKQSAAEIHRLKLKGDGALLQTQRGRALLRSSDKNSDGQLDQTELKSVPEHVWKTLQVTQERLDRNGDGIVDAQELATAEQPTK